ncbi:MAG: hypothetical protein JWM80_5707 [Cyanobacteria bacterium RYN_339]|nr:hypothetical protein [Cyanobacteria bacterium RYN_339]
MRYVIQQTDESNAAERLEALFVAIYGLRGAAQIPGKLALGVAWGELLALLRGGPQPDAPLAPLLTSLYRAAHARGAAERYLEAMAGVRLPLRAAGVHWQRRLGAQPEGAEAFDRALAKLRWEAHGLHLQRQVSIQGEPADWAIAGLLPTGVVLRLAVQLRPEPSPLEALAEDLADDRLAATGFEVLGLRDWQLRYAGTCALEVAAHCSRLAPHLGFPAKLHDPDDDHPVHRLQAAPQLLTPRMNTPQWALREEARRLTADAGPQALLDRYRSLVVASSRASADEDEAPGWG